MSISSAKYPAALSTSLDWYRRLVNPSQAQTAQEVLKLSDINLAKWIGEAVSPNVEMRPCVGCCLRWPPA